MWRLFVLFAIILTVTSCYERQIGCLDTLAANYDVTADNDCDVCCKYPELQMIITEMYGDSTFNPTDTFYNQLGQGYMIREFRCYVSEFHLFQDHETWTIREFVKINAPQQERPDDIKIWKSRDKQTTIGTIRAYGSYDSLQFTFGLDLNTLDLEYLDLPPNHVLQKNLQIKDKNGDTAGFNLRYSRIETPDSIVTLALPVHVSHRFVSKDSIQTSLKGQPIKFNITADYKSLLNNVDLTLSETELTDEIEKNIINFWIVK